MGVSTELRDQNNRLLGRVVLNPEGVAEMEDGSIIHGEMLGETNMILPGPGLVQTDEGEDYLRAVAFTCRSPYCHGVLVGERI